MVKLHYHFGVMLEIVFPWGPVGNIWNVLIIMLVMFLGELKRVKPEVSAVLNRR